MHYLFTVYGDFRELINKKMGRMRGKSRLLGYQPNLVKFGLSKSLWILTYFKIAILCFWSLCWTKFSKLDNTISVETSWILEIHLCSFLWFRCDSFWFYSSKYLILRAIMHEMSLLERMKAQKFRLSYAQCEISSFRKMRLH